MSTARTRRYWGTQRVARVCQVSPGTVAHWIDQGHLPGHRTPTGRRRVEARDLVAFLRAHRMPVPPELWPADEAGGAGAVVVVEDDPSYRRVLVRRLRRGELGVEVVEAVSGVDGLLAIGRVNPAVVVLDYNLPDLDGAQVVARLLAPGSGVAPAVVVVSVGLPPGAEAQLRLLGLDTIVDKVDGMESVVEAVGRALARRQPRG